MSSIQGVNTSAAAYVVPKPQATAKIEAKETSRDEGSEALKGTQETGERQPTPSSSGVGSRINYTA
jgi:hypothetical protein